MNYNEVINSSPVVLVEFYATWCPHCHRMMPVVAQMKDLLQGRAEIYQFDIDENKAIAGQEGVESVPTFIIYRNGKQMWRNSGEMEGDVLLSKIESYM